MHTAYNVDPSKVQEIFIDATYNCSRKENHLYAIMAQELGYGIPLAFILMEIHKDEDTKNKKHDGESSQCNLKFHLAAKEFGIDPKFVHVDKDYAEISPAKVRVPQ